MSECTVTFLHSKGDRVTIKAIGIVGQVEALASYDEGLQYRVAYWNDGQRYSTWLYHWELEVLQ